MRNHFFKAVIIGTIVANSTAALSETTNLRELKTGTVVSQPYKPFAISRDMRDNELSVRTRRSPSYDPANVRIGEFIVAPSIDLFTRYSDNIYLSQNGQSDYLYGVRPELKVKSDFTMHQLEANFYYEDGKYKKFSQEDYDDYGAKLAGRYDFYQGFSMPLRLEYEQQHSRREDVQDRLNKDPTVFNVFRSGTGLRLSGNNIEASVGTLLEDYKYDDTTSFSGDRIDNSDQNRTLWKNTVTVGASQDAIIAPFVYTSYQNVDYEQERDSFNIQRNSHEIETGVGTGINFSRVTKSIARIGWVRRDFDDSSLDPISDFAYSIDLNWEPSTLAAFNLSGQRQIKETSANAAAKLETSLILGMTYELFPNLILEPDVGILNREYEGQAATDFKTTAYTGDMKMTYKLKPDLWSTLEFNHITENDEGNTSGDNADGYSENKIQLSLKFQL